MKKKLNVVDDQITPFKSALVGVVSNFFHDATYNPFNGNLFVKK
jgi:hypothetical protein